MTDAAVLIFELAVPVTSGLKRERQHECGHHDGHDPVRHSLMLEQPNTPTPMLLRRSFQHNRDYNFCCTLANRWISHLQHVPLPGYHLIQNRAHDPAQQQT